VKETELKALINLLDDPDYEVYSIVEKQLLSKGIDVIPALEKAWEESFSELFNQRVELIIQFLQFSNTQNNLAKWVKEGGLNLFEGAFYISQYQYPDVSFEETKKMMQNLKADIEDELCEHITDLEKIRVLNHIIFEVNKFSRNNNDLNTPQNYYLSQVLETKRGNSISLSIIYLLLSQEIGLPIYGVNLPKNFVLAFQKHNLSHAKTTNDILFYINPYNRGAVLGKQEIDFYLKQQNLPQNESYYLPCSNKEIVQNLLQELISLYQKSGKNNKVHDLEKLQRIFTEEVSR